MYFVYILTLARQYSGLCIYIYIYIYIYILVILFEMNTNIFPEAKRD